MPRIKFSFFLVLLVVTVVLIEGDMLFHLLFEVVEIFLEVIEAGLDTFFESVLGLSPRATQVLTAWTAVTLVLGIIWGGVTVYGARVRNFYLRTLQSIKDYYQQGQTAFRNHRIKVYLVGTSLLFLYFMFAF